MAQEKRGESLNRCGKTNNGPGRDHRQHHERFSGTGSPSVGLARFHQSKTQANDSASQTLISEIGQVPFQSRHPRKAQSRRPACPLADHDAGLRHRMLCLPKRQSQGSRETFDPLGQDHREIVLTSGYEFCDFLSPIGRS